MTRRGLNRKCFDCRVYGQYNEHYEKNKANPEQALKDAMGWWRSLKSAPSKEDETMGEWYPILAALLKKERILQLAENDVYDLCFRCHAIRNHAIRVDNHTLGIPPGAPPKDSNTSIALFSKYLSKYRNASGNDIRTVLNFVLYGGVIEKTPDRIWAAISDPIWAISHVGISSLGELAGWAFPDNFPPRNGRSSKALRALGYNVTVHTRSD